MAITIDWPNKIINVGKSAPMVQLQAVPTEIWQLDMDVFRQELNALQATEGIWADTTHSHNTTITVSGAVLARVVQIINGYTCTFEDGQYAVNLVGANTNLADVTNVNQVSVRSANSAGLQDLNSLQAASFNGRVAIDVNSSYTGTIFPVGTRAYPVNNLNDALAIASERGMVDLAIMSSMTIPTGAVMATGYNIHGDNAVTVVLTVEPGAMVQQCEFRNLTLQGDLDDGWTARDCRLLDLNVANGVAERCGLDGDITLTSQQASFFECKSNVPGSGAADLPMFDMNGGGHDLVVRGHIGGLGIRNAADPTDDVTLDIHSGRVRLEPTVTAGQFTIRGNSSIEDQSSANVVDATTSRQAEAAIIPHVWAAAE